MTSAEPRLELLRPLGTGATAEVELVRLLEPFAGLPAGSELARKTLASTLRGDPAAHAAFRAEVEAAAAVRSPSLVRVYHHGERDGRPFLLMPYVAGKTLRELVEQGGPVPEPKLRAIAVELASALAALHAAGLFHGDVKPENVRLDAEGRAVLLDLGFARRSRGEERRGDAGSLAYLAPERARGGGASAPADVFALGVVLY
ncbi:MAG: protein kinase, partial [Planctomycetota bacterium]